MKSFSLETRCISYPLNKLLCLALFLICVTVPTIVSAATVQKPPSEDCRGCHGFRQNMIDNFGGSHGTEIGCLDCHSEHSSENKSQTVACDECHADESHFQVEDCLHCHMNPHKPLDSLRAPLKPAKKECISCHAEVGDMMSGAPSQHSELYCTRCHDSHKLIPSCLDCHTPHLAEQTDFDCLHCHAAHSPSKIEPIGYIPRSFCRVCHVEEARKLAHTRTNHRWVNCVNCHKGQHTSSSSCRDCHGLPHAQAIHSQERKCLACHGDAHLMVFAEDQPRSLD